MGNRDIRQTLAKNLEHFIRSRGFVNPTALADKSGIARATMSEIMNGKTNIQLDTLARLASTLQCQPWELLADDEATRDAIYAKFILGEKPPPADLEKRPRRIAPPKRRSRPPRKRGDGSSSQESA